MELDSFCHPMPSKIIVLTKKEKQKKRKIILRAQRLTHLYMAPGANAYFNRCFLVITLKP